MGCALCLWVTVSGRKIKKYRKPNRIRRRIRGWEYQDNLQDETPKEISGVWVLVGFKMSL